ncbi:hypothetical protein D3C87_1112640 [compost metagenome]
MAGGAAETVVQERFDSDFLLGGVQGSGPGGLAEQIHPGLVQATDGGVRPRTLQPASVDRPLGFIRADGVNTLMGFDAIGSDDTGLLRPVVVEKSALEFQLFAIMPVEIGLLLQSAPGVENRC